MKYTKDALQTLKEVRQDNPNVSQRMMARNIFNLDEPGYRGRAYAAPVDTNTPTMSAALGHPSNMALQHLIRNVDKQIAADKAEAVAAVASVGPKTRKSRARTTVKGAGTRSRKV